MKRIIITELENGTVEMKADQGMLLRTPIVAIELLIESIIEAENITNISIDDILADIKRIYLRDRKMTEKVSSKSDME